MSGFFNNYYYGKAGKADFTPEQLPKNRVQLFFEMLRVRLGGIVAMNLLFVVFALPAIVWSYINLLVWSQNIQEGVEAAQSVLDPLALSYLLGMIPCLMITGVGLTGIIYVLRNWARDQHSFAMSDFKDALKDNWKGGLVIGLIDGLSLLLTYVCYKYYGLMAVQSGVFWVVPQMMVLVVCVVWWMANMLIYPMLVTYDIKLGKVITNSFIMVVARLPWSVLFAAATLVIPLVIVVAAPAYAELILLAVYGIIGFGLTFFMHVSYANSCFDRFLNPRIEGAQVNMGLRDPIYDEEDEEDEANASAEDKTGK